MGSSINDNEWENSRLRARSTLRSSRRVQELKQIVLSTPIINSESEKHKLTPTRTKIKTKIKDDLEKILQQAIENEKKEEEKLQKAIEKAKGKAIFLIGNLGIVGKAAEELRKFEKKKDKEPTKKATKHIYNAK